MELQGGDDQTQQLQIGHATITLPAPYEGATVCVGLELARKQLQAAWLSHGPEDPPMNPRIVGAPGAGKTTLALAVARAENRPVYVMQATADLRPDDLVVQPVLRSGKEIQYIGSALLAAVVNGGVCVLDEGNRMSEKCWATLAPLLDNRRYIDSILIGSRIHAHPEFRFATTMNDDASAFDLPEYVISRLSPKIQLEGLNESELLATFRLALPHAQAGWLGRIVELMRTLDEQGFICSVRDGVQIVRYAAKRLKQSKSDETGSTLKEERPAELSEILAEAALLTLGDDVLPYLQISLLSKPDSEFQKSAGLRSVPRETQRKSSPKDDDDHDR